MRKKVKGKLYFLAKDAKSRMRNYNKEKSIFEQIPYAKACFGVREQELYWAYQRQWTNMQGISLWSGNAL